VNVTFAIDQRLWSFQLQQSSHLLHYNGPFSPSSERLGESCSGFVFVSHHSKQNSTFNLPLTLICLIATMYRIIVVTADCFGFSSKATPNWSSCEVTASCWQELVLYMPPWPGTFLPGPLDRSHTDAWQMVRIAETMRGPFRSIKNALENDPP
jgi:hypothetical protein